MRVPFAGFGKYFVGFEGQSRHHEQLTCGFRKRKFRTSDVGSKWTPRPRTKVTKTPWYTLGTADDFLNERIEHQSSGTETAFEAAIAGVVGDLFVSRAQGARIGSENTIYRRFRPVKPAKGTRIHVSSGSSTPVRPLLSVVKSSEIRKR